VADDCRGLSPVTELNLSNVVIDTSTFRQRRGANLTAVAGWLAAVRPQPSRTQELLHDRVGKGGLPGQLPLSGPWIRIRLTVRQSSIAPLTSGEFAVHLRLERRNESITSLISDVPECGSTETLGSPGSRYPVMGREGICGAIKSGGC